MGTTHSATTNLLSVLGNSLAFLLVLALGVVFGVLALLMLVGSIEVGQDLSGWGRWAVGVGELALGAWILWSCWRFPFSVVREFSFDGKVLRYRTLCGRFRRKSILSIKNVRVIHSRYGEPLMTVIYFTDRSLLCLGESLREGGAEAALVHAIESATHSKVGS